MAKSLIEIAFEIVNKTKVEISFKDLWEQVSKQAGLSEEEKENKISQFYTNLMLDGRFVTLGENMWDLRERHKFDKVHIDMKDVYADAEASYSTDEEDDEENKEYNKVFEDVKEEDSFEMEEEEETSKSSNEDFE